jgi:hypothetical protein
MNKFFPAILSSLIGLSSISHANAQEVKYGLQASVSRSMGDLNPTWYGPIGYGFGLHSRIDLAGGNAIVPRVDFLEYKHDNLGQISKFDSVSVGADFNYSLSKNANHGYYFLVGLGYVFARDSFVITDPMHTTPGGIALPDHSTSERINAPYLAAGLGYAINSNFSAEIRYNYSKFKSPIEASTPSLQASVLFHF